MTVFTNPVQFFRLSFAQFVKKWRQVVPWSDGFLQKRNLIFCNGFDLSEVVVIFGIVKAGNLHLVIPAKIDNLVLIHSCHCKTF